MLPIQTGTKSKKIRSKYSKDFALRNLLEAKLRWYGYKANWEKYTKYITELINLYPQSVPNGNINDYAFEIFLYSKNKTEINDAIAWMKKIVSTDTSYFMPNA